MQRLLAVMLCGALHGTAGAQVRVFMTVDGDQLAAPSTGPTTISLTPCDTVTVGVFIEDLDQSSGVNAYQLMIPWTATPAADAVGEVSYVNHGTDLAFGVPGCRECAPFKFDVQDPDLAMDGQSCVTDSDCCSSGDRCTWCECADGTCTVLAVQAADFGGPYGACLPDGHVGLHDHYHATNCWFGNQICPFNIDIVGRGGSCWPDEFCDGFDIFAVSSVFERGLAYLPCSSDVPSGNAVSCMGDSIQYDNDRLDAIFNGGVLGGPLVYAERAAPPVESAAFGMMNAFASFLTTSVEGVRNLGTFELTASADACGEFTLVPNAAGTGPSGGTYFITGAPGNNDAVPYVIDEYQPLVISVSPDRCPAPSVACCDVDANGVADDLCQWCAACPDGSCTALPRAQPADIGGPFGDCMPDTHCNIHDANLARAAFEGSTACAAINLDAGGPFGTCAADGFTNVHDVNHALACFEGTSTCVCGPAPLAPTAPTTVAATRLILRADRRTVRAGERLAVRAFLAEPVPALQSYQLHAAVTGGQRGHMEVVEFVIEERSDAVFAGATGMITGSNAERAQVFAAVPFGNHATAGTYLATLRLRAGRDARGPFAVDLLIDEATGDQTFMIAHQAQRVAVTAVRPAVVTVTQP